LATGDDALESLQRVGGDRETPLTLTVEDNVMSISGERKYEKEEKGKKYHRVERAYGSFMRSFTLPDAADGSKVNAEYKDGVLNVRLPKSEKAKPKSIEVKVS
jgi:HSP20 family protein